MAQVVTDRIGAGAYIVSTAADMLRSQEQGTLAAGTVGVAGMVLGRLTATKKLVPFDEDAATGAEKVHGILYDNVDATGGDRRVAFTRRDMELNGHLLTWPDGIDLADKTAAEAAMADDLGLVVRY